MPSKYGKVDEVIDAFARGNEKTSTNKGETVWHEDGRLFSYRTCIAVLGAENRPAILNGDRYSTVTDRHVSDAWVYLNATDHSIFTTSFSALARFIEYATGQPFVLENDIPRFLQKDKLIVLDHKEDFRAFYTQKGTWEALEGSNVHGGVERKEVNLPSGVTIYYDQWGNPRTAHRAATALFGYANYTAIAGFDENQFFLSILPTNPNTLEEAYNDLKPEDVHLAERDGLNVYRQGEWFFIPHLDGPEALEEYNKMVPEEYALLGQNEGNPHIATRGYPARRPHYLHDTVNKHVVSGRIRHPEHRVLRLSYRNNPIIFLAVENTALASYSAHGRVD